MADSHVEVTRSLGVTLVTVVGFITETFDPSAVPRDVGTAEAPLRIDLGEVYRFNSSGVREWRRFVRTLTPGSFRLERCPVCFIQQLGMVHAMAPTEAVVSLFVPFFCARCRVESTVLAPVDGARALAAQPPACNTCGLSLEFDDLPEVYFNWMRRAA